MSSPWDLVAWFVAGLASASAFGWVLFRNWRRNAEAARKRMAEVTIREAELSLRERQSALELAVERERLQRESAISARAQELERERESMESTRAGIEAREGALARRAGELERDRAELERRGGELERLTRELVAKLEAASGADRETLRRALTEEVRRECEDELRGLRRELLERGETELLQQARGKVAAVIQRISSQSQHDLSATVVRLPSEDMKGRIIGREGRNIKAFESATGTTLLIDETPDSVLVSSFDPVRREVARRALENLMRDGRIHPAAIEEFVAKAEAEVREKVQEFGEDALRRLRLGRVHPEVVALVGRMRYRLANNQNTLDHSIEVGHIAGLLAAEVGVDPEPARRAGLLHDIGKVLDQDHEGSHAIAGARVLERYGESRLVVNAVAAHHEEVPAESLYAALVMSADSLSAQRPGARAEAMESYLQRVRRLEDLARREPGVTDAYALQAGREVRVVVDAGKVGDDEARQLARTLRRRIEDELQYPGTIRVTVVREARFVETAK